MVKLKVSNDCILCGACMHVEGSKFKMGNSKVSSDEDYSDEVAQEIIDVCPVEAISKA